VQQETEKQVNVVCDKAKAQQNALSIRYQHEKNILAVVNGYDF